MQSYNFLHYLQINILLLLSINNLVIFVQQMPGYYLHLTLILTTSQRIA